MKVSIQCQFISKPFSEDLKMSTGARCLFHLLHKHRSSFVRLLVQGVHLAYQISGAVDELIAELLTSSTALLKRLCLALPR